MIKLIFAGFGGQGVLFMGRVLVQAALFAEREVTWIPAYGPEMRGGTANCSVIISDKKIGCPTVGTPDIAVAMNRASYEKFMPKVNKGGILLVNSSLVPELPGRDDIRMVHVPANTLAHELDLDGAANMVMLGALQQVQPVLEEQFLVQALTELSRGKAALIEANLRAFNKGKQHLIEGM